MKKSFKSGLALLLAVLMVLTTGLYSADGFLRATDGTPSQSEESQAVEEQNADATKASETETIEVPKQDPAEDSTATDAEQNEQMQASAADQGNSNDASGNADADKVTAYDVVIEEPSENGGTVKVWTDGSDEEEVAFTDGSFIKSVDEGGVLNVEITAKEGYSVKTVTENDKNINADSVYGSVYTYKINVNENKKLTVSYNRESSGSNGSNESSTSNGSQDNSTANKDEESSDDSDDSDPLPLGGIAADIPANILSGIATPFAVPMILTAGAAVSMPAQTFTDIASNGVKVTVYAPEGALPEGTTMKVTAISKKEAKAIYADTVDDSEKVTDAIGVDITFFKDGQEIEPEKDVKVQMETPALEGADYGIAHMRNNGNVELITDSASATGATFKSDEFSIYVAGGTEEKENVISVTVNYLSSNNFKLKDSDVYYVEADTNGYCIFNDYELLEEIEGKTLDKDAVTVDNNVVYDKENGTISISVKLGEGVATEYEINAVYKATMAEYTVEYAFEKLDGSGYEVDTDKTETASGEVGNYTDTSSESLKKNIPGFTAKEVEEQKITADGKTVVTVEYDRNTYRVIYNTNGGSYVKAKSGKHGETVTISTGSISSEFVCTKEEHTHTAKPTEKAKYHRNEKRGCYTSTKSGDSWSWTLSCGKEEHTHGEGCYEEVNTITPTTSKNGYTFGGWYMDEACTIPAVLATIDAADVEVYAKWIPGKANYTIVYQKQNIDGTYSYISSKTAAGTVGTTVTADDGAGNFKNSAYYEFAGSSEAVLSANGSTVVYANYNLKEYKITFNLNKDNASLTIGGNTYRYGDKDYSIDVKLGQNIADLWPTAQNIPNVGNDKFYTWSISNQTYATKNTVVSTELLGNGESTELTAKAAWSKSLTQKYVRYWIQTADGSAYEPSEEYSQYVNLQDGLSAKELNGLTRLGSSNNPSIPSTGNYPATKQDDVTITTVTGEEFTGTVFNFYYNRNTYRIDYTNGGVTTSENNIKYGADISTPQYTKENPKHPETIDSEYIFAGWYENVACEGEPYTFTTMPASILALYAKWQAPEKTVTLIYNNGEDDGSITVAKGSSAEIPTPTRAGYIFSGWFIAGTDTEFDINAPITKDIEIEAKWEAKNFTSYTVKYIDEEGNNLLDPYTSEENVQVGSKKIIYAEPIEGYVPDKASVDVTFVAGTNEIVFTYSNLYGITYKIQYVDKDGNVVIPAGDNAFKVTSSPQIATADKAMLNNNGYKLVAGEKSKKHFTPSSNNDENIVSFTVELKYYSISYTNVAKAWAEKQVPTYTINDEVKIATPAPNDGLEPKEGYEFIGWDYNTKDAILGTDITVTPEHSHTETVISEGSHANIEFKACWAKIKAEDATYTYSGTGKSIATAKVVDKAGNEYSGYTVTYSLKKDGEYTAEIPTKTDAGTYPIYIKAEKTGYKTITKVVTLTINPATLTVTTPSENKVYDGEALTAKGSISGFVNNETAKFETTGSQTEVGDSANTYSITWDGTATASNYTISESLGTLKVTEYAKEITVTTTGGTFTYNGEAHGATVSVSTLPKGYTLETATSSATATHVAEGTVAATCDVLVIRNAQGVDVTSNLNIKYVNGSITITPATLTVTTSSDSKVYDGDPLTAEGSITGFVKEETATFTTTGIQTEVGSSKNTYSITWNGTAVESDYTISETIGTLKVTEYSGEITVTTTGGTFTYDGIAHEATVSVSTLPKGYTLETATSDDSATHVAEGTVTANCDTLVIRNAAGEDVTSKLNIKYVDGSITITPVTLTVTTPSDTKVYDSEALTAAGSITGFVNDETATFTTTGSRTEVGSSKNTYSITWDGTAEESDYTISESIGTLTVTENTDEIVVTTTGGEFTYDGIAHGATVSVSTLPKGYTLETATSDDSATNVADGTVTANCDTLVIQNAAGEDVTSKLNIKYVNGSIKINPATLTVVTNGATKKYDDAALTADGSIKGFVNGESAVFTVTGSQKYVGSSDNTYNIDWDNDATTASKGNYTINESVGILEVTDVDADPVTKTHDSTKAYAPGDVIEFTIVVKNIYDENKTIEIQEQEGVTIKGSAKAENVRPGETATFTAEYTVTEADIINGTYTNTVTAKFSGVNNPFTKDDKVEEFVDPNGQLDVTKRTTSTPANGEKYALGEKIQYEITVKNVGNLTLTGVVVEDALTYDEWTVGTLAPGASKTYTAEYTVTEADVLNGKVVNNAAATGTSPVPGADPVTDTATKEDLTDEANGHLKVTKTTTSTPENGNSYALGEKITYAIKVTNDGNLTATNVVVTDALTGDEWTVGTLAPGETSELYTAEHTVTEADILAEEVANVATATGTTSDPEGTDVEKGEAVDPTEVAKPSLFIKKEAVDNPSAVKLGDTINYVITVTNNGNVTIKNVKVTDDLTGDKAEYKALKPGESQELKVSYKVTEQDILNGKVSNVATVTGEPPEGDPIEETSKKDVTTEDPKGHITVTKETTSKPENGKTYALGETIQYEITVTNDGNLTIKDVTVTDELTGDKWNVGTFKPGDEKVFTAEYTVKEADIKAGKVVNVATATGESPDPKKPVVPVKPGEKEEPTDPVNAVYTVEKTTLNTQNEYKVGDKIEYQIKVTNTGNVTIKDITVTDQLLDASGKVIFTDLAGAKLNSDNTVTIDKIAPNGEITLKCEYTVVREDAGKEIVNTAITESKTEIPDPEDPTKPPIKPVDPTDNTDPAPVEKMYTLTIHYVYANGDKAAEDVTGQYLAGERYDAVQSPTINGYTPDIDFVRSGEGGMPARDVEITVTYTANPTPAQVTTTDGGNNPAPRGVAIQANDDGGVDVVPVVDEKVPLARQDLSDHACCILHFLLMLLAMIILICYTVDMKKRQKRIAELKDELETEQIKRSGLSH